MEHTLNQNITAPLYRFKGHLPYKKRGIGLPGFRVEELFQSLDVDSSGLLWPQCPQKREELLQGPY